MSTSEKGTVMNVYDVIKSPCDERGLAVTALEKELGFGRGSIGKLKKGGSTTADRLRKIADFFGVSVTDLMTDNVSSYDPDFQNTKNFNQNSGIFHTQCTRKCTQKKRATEAAQKVKGENMERSYLLYRRQMFCPK